ncbi:MAG: YdbH domain-containing protein [Rickettsiales bacterium]|nr:YdbH domain-containing protein [Rickettsiales bacterium]
MRRISLIVLVLLIAVVVAALLAPWKVWLETRLKQEAQDRSVAVEFSIEQVGLHGITFVDVSFAQLPFTIDKVTASYSLLDLLQGQLQTIEAPELMLKMGKQRIIAKDAVIRFEQPKAGSWHMKDISVSDAPLPLLAGEGKFSLQDSFAASGTLISADKSYYARFNSDDELLVISEAAMPYKGGVISTKNARVPLKENKPTAAVLQVKNMPLDALMKLITQDRATATGEVSGMVPLTIGRDGSISIGTGLLKTASGGVISVQPEVLPSDNQQVGLVRDVLKNFSYTQLSMDVKSLPHDKLSILLQLSGNNPQVYNGREIKLNVHLTGNLIELVQQSILPLNDPNRYLE